MEAWVTHRGGQPIPETASLEGVPLGEKIDVEIRLTPGSQGVGSYAVSVRFDGDGTDVLDLVSVERLQPAGFQGFPVPVHRASVESDSNQPGRVNSIAAMSFPPDGGLAAEASPERIARLQFATRRSGSARIEVGPFEDATDGVFWQDGTSQAQPVYRSALVSVPEPTPLAGMVLLYQGRAFAPAAELPLPRGIPRQRPRQRLMTPLLE